MFLLLPSVAFGQASPALQLTTRIALPNVDGRMDHLSVDLAGQRLFATAFDNHTVSVIDLKSGKQTNSIANVDEPQAAYYDAATNHLFVSAGGDGSVRMFDGTTFQLLQTIKYSADSDNLRYDAKNKHVIVGYGGEKFLYGAATRQQGDGAMGIMDLQGKKVSEIPTDAHPESFQLEQMGTRIFINVPDKKEIQVADLATGKTVAHWAVSCPENFPMALDEAHHRVIVACRNPSGLAVFDTTNGKQVALVPMGQGLFSDDIFFDAAKALARKTLESRATTDADRIDYAFRCVLSRHPTDAEQKELQSLLNKERQRFADGWKTPNELVNGSPEPAKDLPPGMTPTQLAAYTVVSRVLLNLDEAMTKE